MADLQKKIDLLNYAINAVGVGTWTLDPVKQVVQWDERCREMFGFARGDVVRYTQVLDYVFPEDRMIVEEAVASALTFESGGNYEAHFRTLGPSGQLRWLHCKGIAYFDDNKVPYLFAGTAQDVTDIINLREKDLAYLKHAERALQSARAGAFKVHLRDDTFEYTPLLKKIFTGSSEGVVTRVDLINAIHPDDILIRDLAYEVAFRTGHLEYEVRILWPDRTTRWIRVTGAYEYDKQGKPVVLSGIAIDSTDIKIARNVIEDSEARFRALIQQAPIGTCLFVGEDMKIAIANEIMIGYWGKGKSVLNKPLIEAVPELKGQPFLDILVDIYKTGKTYHTKAARAELEVDGVKGIYYFDFTYKPIFDSKGDVYGIMDMAVDVTQQVEAQIKADEADAALKSAIHIAKLEVWEIDLQREEIAYSDTLRQWIGSSDVKCSLEFFFDAVNEEDRDNMRQALANVKNIDWKEPYNIEFAVTNRKSGVKRILHSRGKAIFDHAGKPVKIMGLTQDITEQRDIKLELEREVQMRTEEFAASNEELAASNEELQASVEELAQANNSLSQSNQELEQYAYAASHDLQEPLRKIQLFTDRLINDDSVQGSGRTHAVKINDSANRMTLLIKDLLNFSRLQVREDLFNQVDLNKLVKDVLNDFELTIESEKALINVGDLPAIEGIEGQLRQLFQNLISNALKFIMEDQRPVIDVNARLITPEILPEYTINFIPDVRYFDITIADNGIGFNEQYTKQIFEIFKRLHDRALFPGSGIGLALCKRIVNNHSGYITVDSHLGQGSVFHIVLPEKQKTR